MSESRLSRITALLFLVLLLNSFYLAGFPEPTVFYMGNVLVHIGVGVIAAVLFAWVVFSSAAYRERLKWTIWPLGISAALGAILAAGGATHSMRWFLWTHIAFAALGTLLLLLAVRSRVLRIVTLAGVVLLGTAHLYRVVKPESPARVVNTTRVPLAMEEEGGGPTSPFWPSSARTNVGGTIPAKFFMDSKVCGECHKEIYDQWNSSMHHFSSFNNQFYRKSIEHMQEISGTQGSKWCAGCHDHAVFFNGRFEKPMKQQMETPEALTGLGCVSCHSITHVDGSMGNGGFTIEYPPLHDLASSQDPLIHGLARYLTFTNPRPHRKTFLKPFMKDSSEFCSACHKVHLDVPVNNYRWLRGINDYDNWQASGVSGQGARSFYYPKEPSTCAGCHMPLVKAPTDPAARNGMVHSHRFPAANTAVPTANQDAGQLKATEEFLKSGFISVDIFAASPAEEAPGIQMLRRASENQTLSSTMAVGEESEQTGQLFLREVGKVSAPIDRAGATFQAGTTLRVDVVVRTRKIGHFFPAGTVDAFDTWLELQGRDATGKTIFWSGRVEDEGRGPVEPGAHFYKAFLLDGAGNPINKRNAWQARSVFYVRLIPPGAADVAHYRVKIPMDAKGPITLTARLNYRKFTHYYTQFAYAGQPKAGQDPKTVSIHYDGREYDFSKANIPANVPGVVRDRIPELPVIVLASAEAKLPLGAGPTEWKPLVRKSDRERWNDWGIGLLLQGDLKGAQYAFERVTEAEPEYADGWVNVARALIQEGETEAAKAYLAKAMAADPSLGRTRFFKSQALKADGDYDGAAAELRAVLEKYPRDRVVLNQLGRVLFLKREYRQAIATLKRVLLVDPEDLQAHYNLMLSYRGLGDAERAAQHERLFRRFKADENAQTITFTRRMVSPEDNNERQQIHEHESVVLK